MRSAWETEQLGRMEELPPTARQQFADVEREAANESKEHRSPTHKALLLLGTAGLLVVAARLWRAAPWDRKNHAAKASESVAQNAANSAVVMHVAGAL